MKKLFLLFMAAAIFASCKQSASSNGSTADAGISATNAPVMKFDKPLHDFGKIHAGEKVNYDFKFTNSGKSPLIITDAVATCGCTKPTWPTRPIQPNEAGIIHLTFDSNGKMGLQDKMVTITANTNPPQNMVHLIGEVLTVK